MFYPIAIPSPDIGAEITADQARLRTIGVEGKLDAVSFDIERLLMITEALWMLLKKEHGYTDDVLLQRIREIDLRDGELDGRVAVRPPGPCPECGRPLARKRPLCIYCGKPVEADPFMR